MNIPALQPAASLPSVQASEGLGTPLPQPDTPGTAGMTEGAAVDFDKGLYRCARRAELYRRLGMRFLDSRSHDGAKIRSAVEEGNLEAAAILAHQLISSAGVLGADTLSSLARALQMSLLEGPSADWPSLLDAFDQQLTAVTQALKRHFADTP